MSARNSSRSRAVGTRMKTRRPTSTAPGRFTAALLLAQDDDHDDGVPGALEHLLGLAAEDPLDELEAAGQLDQSVFGLKPQQVLERTRHPIIMVIVLRKK